jgi:hypothetical protein
METVATNWGEPIFMRPGAACRTSCDRGRHCVFGKDQGRSSKSTAMSTGPAVCRTCTSANQFLRVLMLARDSPVDCGTTYTHRSRNKIVPPLGFCSASTRLTTHGRWLRCEMDVRAVRYDGLIQFHESTYSTDRARACSSGNVSDVFSKIMMNTLYMFYIIYLFYETTYQSARASGVALGVGVDTWRCFSSTHKVRAARVGGYFSLLTVSYGSSFILYVGIMNRSSTNHT